MKALNETVLYTLPVNAVDNHGHEYEVKIVTRKTSWDPEGLRPTVVVTGTPGQWYVSTLVNNAPSGHFAGKIAIDFGQNWFVVNYSEVLDAILAWHKLNPSN